jgi:TnpA family transposase
VDPTPPPGPDTAHAALARRARLTDEDRTQIARLRHDHTRLGFAYQIAFVRLTGRLPRQRPFEVEPNVLRSVAGQLRLTTGTGGRDRADELAARYAARQPTVSAHADAVRRHLGVRPFGPAEREGLEAFVRGEAAHMERPAGLVARAEEHLRHSGVLLPAVSAVRRVVGSVRAEVLDGTYQRAASALSDEVRWAIDALLVVDGDAEEGAGRSPLHALKEPPGVASPRALLAETEKLDALRATGALDVDLSWMRASLRKALAHRARYASAHRLRELRDDHRYAALVCFVQEAHADTVDHVVDLHGKLVTQTYRRAERRLDVDSKERRRVLAGSLKSLREIGRLVLDGRVADADLRRAILDRVPEDALREQVEEAEAWTAAHRGEVFPRVADRLPYLRQFSPSLVGALDFEVDPAGGSTRARALVESVDVLRAMNAGGKRRVPPDAPTSFIPKGRRRFVETGDGIDRAAYEAAVLTALRDEIRRGNVAVRGSKRFGHLSDLFMPEDEWEAERAAFFERAGLPVAADEAVALLERRLSGAYDRFLRSLPKNGHVTFGEDGAWRFSKDPAEALVAEDEERLAALHDHLDRRMRQIRLPDLLIEVDNVLGFTRHLTPTASGERAADDVCQAVAAVIAYGCNLGPQTMASLTDGVGYDQIKRVADTHLHGDALRQALADVVNGISGLDTARVWGDGQTSSSDGQRFLFPRRTVKRTYSHRMGDYALEFYSFIANNYAPFYSAPIECVERDAGYVLDGLLYHESDLEIDEHYTDTHGYSEVQFAAFASLGKRFCPRIRGLHKQRIYRTTSDEGAVSGPERYGKLWPMLSARDRRLRLDWVAEEWDQIGRFFCSLATGHTTASVAMKRVVAFGGGNHFYRAVREMGRVFKTEFVLDYVARPDLRRRVRRGLLKSEELHALARTVFYGKLGRVDARDFRRQASTASCLTLILASIIYWQIREIERVLADDDGGLDLSLLAHISPIQWDNVALYGEYDIRRDLVTARLR